jgi:hypothetical protein
MQTQSTEREVKVLAGVLLLLVALLFGASILKSFTQDPKPARRISAPSAPAVQRSLYCPECQAAGQSVNVWSDSSMQSVACRLDWNVPVAVVEQYGGMSLITGNGCLGWVRTSLLR